MLNNRCQSPLEGAAMLRSVVEYHPSRNTLQKGTVITVWTAKSVTLNVHGFREAPNCIALGRTVANKVIKKII